MQVHELSNDRLSIKVALKGAELQSLLDLKNNREWLWQGDETYWGKRSPVLFPFVGAVKEGVYKYCDQSYPMTKHGFARDRDFLLESRSENHLTFLLKSDEATLSIYPFRFEFRITYQLHQNKLTIIYEVSNQSHHEMIFSIGGHPAFNCPMDREKWQLEFEEAEHLETFLINEKNGLIKGNKKSLPVNGKPLVLSGELFKKDALIFDHLESHYVDLAGPAPEDRIRFEIGKFPLLAFWSPEAPFLCIEPWFGMADKETSSGHLEHKPGTVTLVPDTAFKTAYSVIVMPSHTQLP